MFRYYSGEWLSAVPNHVPPHKDKEISIERDKCLKRYLPDTLEMRMAITEFANFSAGYQDFVDQDALELRGIMEPNVW